MSDTNSPDDHGISRRRLLGGAGSIGLFGLGSVPVAAGDSGDGLDGTDCSETTIRPGTIHYDDSIHDVCSDDNPETEAIQSDVRASLETEYDTVGALIDAGFIPYFDFFADGDWSHWIHPEFIGDESVLDPDRPESVLVDHEYWRPFGVMFIATEDGDHIDPPPAVYTDGEDASACTPWHAHVGVPGRSAWWKYRAAYEEPIPFPCRTPWMLHVWKYSHSESVYAHSAPEERGGPPAEPAGFETDADPDEEELGPEHLSDAVLDKVEDLW